MKKLLMILTMIVIWNFSNGQSIYYPINKETTLTYAYGSDLYNGAYDNVRLKVMTLNSTEVIDGKEYYISETSSGSDGKYTPMMTSYVRVGKDGSVLVRQEGDDDEYIFIQTSSKVDDTWPSRNGTLASTTRVTSLDGIIKTDTKTYTDCLVLEQKTEDGRIMQSYFVKDLGMVASTITMDGSEKIFIYLINE